MELLNFRANGNNTGTVRLSVGIVYHIGKNNETKIPAIADEI